MIKLSKVFKGIRKDKETYAYAYIKKLFDTKGHHYDGFFVLYEEIFLKFLRITKKRSTRDAHSLNR